jgi:hypothetical protein
VTACCSGSPHAHRVEIDGVIYKPQAATHAHGGWTIYASGWQPSGTPQGLDETYVPFLGAFGTAWGDGVIARWSANPLGMMWPEMDAAIVASGGGGDPPPWLGVRWSSSLPSMFRGG